MLTTPICCLSKKPVETAALSRTSYMPFTLPASISLPDDLVLALRGVSIPDFDGAYFDERICVSRAFIRAQPRPV